MNAVKWESWELEKVRQLLEGRYHRKTPGYAWFIAGACAAGIMAAETLIVFAFFFLSAAVQLYIGAGYRKEMNRLSPGFRWPVACSYVMAADCVLIGIAGVPLRLLEDSVDINEWIFWVYSSLLSLLGLFAVVRMYCYLAAMRRLSESIRPQSGSVWGAQIRRCILSLILLAVMVAIGWAIAYFESGMAEFANEEVPKGRNGLIAVLFMVLTAMLMYIIGFLLSVISLLIVNFIMRRGERRAAEALLAIVNEEKDKLDGGLTKLLNGAQHAED